MSTNLPTLLATFDLFGVEPAEADDIRRTQARIVELDATAKGAWLEIGRELNRIRRETAFGQHARFGAWCAEALPFSARTAQRLMAAAEWWQKTTRESHLDVAPPSSRVAQALAAAPLDVQRAFASKLLDGEEVSSSEVIREAAKAKAARRTEPRTERAVAARPVAAPIKTPPHETFSPEIETFEETIRLLVESVINECREQLQDEERSEELTALDLITPSHLVDLREIKSRLRKWLFDKLNREVKGIVGPSAKMDDEEEELANSAVIAARAAKH